MNIPKLLRLAVILLATQLLGCSYQEQLEEVAKNWCMTIRASQVIPVYPLTEDLEPGDVFLVQTCVPRQAEQYKKKGFLPLDMHMVRLDIPRNEFLEFYDDFYDLVPNHEPDKPPHIWQDKATNNNNGCKLKNAEAARHRNPTNWPKAPRAGFPSYTFEVKHGIAGAAALPIKGIPVAMSLLGADKATGSVTIKDSYTYGIPYDNIVQKLSTWAWENKDLLNSIREGVIDAEPFPDQLWRFLSSPFVGHLERTIYLRIINRVYLTGSLTVSMTNTSAAAVKAATQSFKDASLPNLSSAKDVNNYTKNIDAINKTLAPQHIDTKQDPGAIGAALNVTSATFRSISIDERFDRPLVIGYLAFDFPVLDGGRLGMPVATINQISRNPVPSQLKFLTPRFPSLLTSLLVDIRDKLKQEGKDPNIVNNLDEASNRILLQHCAVHHKYNFDNDNSQATLERSDIANTRVDSAEAVNTLSRLWSNYQRSITDTAKAIETLEKGKSVLLLMGDARYHLNKGESVTIEGQVHKSMAWLRKHKDYYLTQRKQLDDKIQTCPEIINAVDFYFSLFKDK
jgi:hypothetical protein